MDNDRLKEQFKILQDQKRKRLMKKNEIKVENSRTPKDDSSTNPVEKSAGNCVLNEVEENLNLQLGYPTAGHYFDIKETDDYKDLLETLRELRDENGRLDKLLAEKEEEIKIVRRRWKLEREELAGGGIASGNAASKIIEFSKKIRELNTVVEKEKTKSQTLEKKLEFLERNASPQEKKLPCTQEETSLIEMELSSVKEKLSKAQIKCAEGKNEIDLLKKELKIAQKVLTREVGENVTFQSLLNGSVGWRGRQQQILALQLKVSELQQQIDSSHQATGNAMLSRNALLGGISLHDEKHRLVMRKIELERKEQQDKLQKELTSVTAERDSYKEKNNAARARNKIITHDLKNVKDQLSTLIDKGKHDDELVSALLREQQCLKEENENLKGDISNHQSLGERVVKASGVFSVERLENNDLVIKLKDEIKFQEERVKELEIEIGQLRSSKYNYRHNPSLIPRPLSSGSRSSVLLKADDGTSPLQAESPNLKLQECRSLYEAAKVEKEKLSELLQILQRRNEELGKQLLEKDFLINEFRNSNVTLQKRIEKLSLSQRNLSVSNISGTKNNKKKNVETCLDEIGDIETKLCIQMDNNDALKSALEETLRAKEEDSKYYHHMIEQTKNIFLQGLRQYRQAHSGNS